MAASTQRAPKMNPEHAITIEQIRTIFLDREAIYVEKGALRVRIIGIQVNAQSGLFEVLLEEVPTPGFGVGLFHSWESDEPTPRQWSVATVGDLSEFTDDVWTGHYISWAIFFAPYVVQGVVDPAAHWPDSLETFARYNELNAWLSHHHAFSATQEVFPTTLM